jgi:carotenoid 1,2-hydratase
MNVALHGPSERAWALTERQGARRGPTELEIGRSSVRFTERGELEVSFAERGAPLPLRLEGKVRLVPELLGPGGQVLDAAGDHAWWPIAPRARAEVTLTAPGVRFSGDGYFDANTGACPLEATFREWSWCRAATHEGGATIAYHAEEIGGAKRTLDLAFDARGTHAAQGRIEHVLPGTGWGLSRKARAAKGATVEVTRTLEDTPFYARSQVRICGAAGDAIGVHESLSLERFRKRWVQLLLPMRIRRVGAR